MSELKKLMIKTHNAVWEAMIRCEVTEPNFCEKECEFYYECPNTRGHRINMMQKRHRGEQGR